MGLFFLKLALATQGLGAVVPQIPFPDISVNVNINKGYFDSYVNSIFDEAIAQGESALIDKVNATIDPIRESIESCVDDIEGLMESEGKVKNEEDFRTFLFDELRKEEGIIDSNSTLKRTGLVRIKSDADGKYLFISAAKLVVDHYREYGFASSKAHFRKPYERNHLHQTIRKASRNPVKEGMAHESVQKGKWTVFFPSNNFRG